MRRIEEWYHGLECLANAALLLRDDVSQDPEAGIHERDEEENGVEHSDHIEELAFSLRLTPLLSLSHISIRRKRNRRDRVRQIELLLNELQSVRLHRLQLLLIQHIQPVPHLLRILRIITISPVSTVLFSE